MKRACGSERNERRGRVVVRVATLNELEDVQKKRKTLDDHGGKDPFYGIDGRCPTVQASFPNPRRQVIPAAGIFFIFGPLVHVGTDGWLVLRFRPGLST
jgi:hypothetical protein